MTEKLYLSDSYQKTCQSTVQTVVEGTQVVLDKTVFYATSGGQPNDLGVLTCKGVEYKVVDVKKQGNDSVVHYLDKPGLEAGDLVECSLDWERRYKLMRMHTAMHVLGAVMDESGWKFAGNQIGEAQSRVDFTMDNFDRPALDGMVAKANELLSKDAEIKVSEMPREQALSTPGMVKLANVLPPDIPVLRTVEIVGIDFQADGGTHVHNTGEVGQITIDKLENKGAHNKRLYFSLAT